MREEFMIYQYVKEYYEDWWSTVEKDDLVLVSNFHGHLGHGLMDVDTANGTHQTLPEKDLVLIGTL